MFVFSDPGNCPTGWLKYDKHCYFVKNSYYGTKNWAAARQLCLDFGADLASIHSELEQTVLYEKLIKGSKSVWIGRFRTILYVFVENGFLAMFSLIALF